MVVNNREKGMNVNEHLNKGKESVIKFGSFLSTKVSSLYQSTKEKLTNKDPQ